MSCGYYMNSITDRLPFPDRSPRPIIAFKTIQEWNKKNRVLYSNILKYTFSPESTQKKEDILLNWEMVLCKEWMETIYKPSKESEKWFNHTIRMFTLELLKSIENKPDEIKKLIKTLADNVR